MNFDSTKVNLVSSNGRHITLEQGYLYHIRTCDTIYKSFFFSHVDYDRRELVFFNYDEEYKKPACIPLEFIHFIWTCEDDYSRFPSECVYCRVD